MEGLFIGSDAGFACSRPDPSAEKESGLEKPNPISVLIFRFRLDFKFNPIFKRDKCVSYDI